MQKRETTMPGASFEARHFELFSFKKNAVENVDREYFFSFKNNAINCIELKLLAVDSKQTK